MKTKQKIMVLTRIWDKNDSIRSTVERIATTAKLFEDDDEIEEQIYQITFRNLY